MICRPAVKPIFVGLGTAAILAAGGASAVAGAETPSPSPSGSETTSPAKPGTLKVSVTPLTQDSAPGKAAVLHAVIGAEGGALTGVKVANVATTPASADATVGGDCPAPFNAAGCTVGEIKSDAEDQVNLTLSIPESTDKTVTVTVTVTVSATDVQNKSAEAKVTYVVPPVSTTPPPDKPGGSPSDKPSDKPTKPSPGSPSSGGGGGSGGGSGGGGSDGTSGGSSGGGSSAGSGTGGYVPPAPNSSFNPGNPRLVLPPVTSPNAPNPSVAPSPALTPQSRLQGNKAPVAQDLTFERMASTQIAWLAALMVAFSLLLTQARLGRRRLSAGAAKRVKGTHRRPRKGVFGK